MPAPSADEILDFGLSAIVAGDMAAAEQALAEATALLSEDHGRVCLLAGLLAHARGEPDLALRKVEGIGPGDPAWIEGLDLRAALLFEGGRVPEAIELLRSSVAAAPTDPDLRYLLSVVLEDSGDLEAALVEKLEVLALDTRARDPLDPPMAEHLRDLLACVLEDLPQEVLMRLGSAPLIVQDHPTPGQVLAGADPRGAVHLDTSVDPEHGLLRVEAIRLMAGPLLDRCASEEELVDVLTSAAIEEILRVRDRDEEVGR